jgi:hypothetical protein
MIKILIISLLFLISTTSAFAGWRYNPYERRWEDVPQGSRWFLKRNPYSGEWSYQPPKAHLKRNPYNNRWYWSQDDYCPKDKQDYFWHY